MKKQRMPTVSAIIPAAGVGKRFDADIKKQFFLLGDYPVLYYAMKMMNDSYPFDEFVVGAHPEDFKYISRIADKLGITRFTLTPGGDTRAATVLNALRESVCDFAAVHDAARPFVSSDTVKNTVKAGIKHGGAICGVYARDTVKRIKDGMIVCTEDRDTVFLAHTPQVFSRNALLAALEKAETEKMGFTDESAAFEAAGHKVAVCLSGADNIKITEPADIPLAQALVKRYFSAG
ncbi:MAG: 2-C-methyl-D-erythritol 4-phosphate cytidylyltransferase [Deferribacteraceae bacterium]|jgi:2-C-methyl-D-erythritol 4-phosphate cytidylyltransferase|nr:2-C-methyl-D-erythritol 4-phosphate cytidylyltransferase [Deferribacteraceae bacterium]